MCKMIKIYSCFSCDKKKYYYGKAYCKMNEMSVETEFHNRTLHKECQLEDYKHD